MQGTHCGHAVPELVEKYDLNDRGSAAVQTYPRVLREVDSQGRHLGETYTYNTATGGAYLPIAAATAANVTRKVHCATNPMGIVCVCVCVGHGPLLQSGTAGWRRPF